MLEIYAEYKRVRRAHTFLPASHALRWAKVPDYSALWEEGSPYGTPTFSREVDGFTVELRVEIDSYCPERDSMLGEYVDATRYERDGWGGNYPDPGERFPLGLPPKIFASGAYSQDRHACPYFIPSGVEEEYEAYRRDGASRSVAWMLTYEMVEKTIRDLFGAPLVNAYLSVTVSLEGVELGSAGIGTDFIDDSEGRGYVFTCVAEHGLVDEALEQARETLARLAA